MFSKQDQIQGYDDALLAAMNAEEQRQEDHIELIELVPDGAGGWLERPATITLENQ